MKRFPQMRHALNALLMLSLLLLSAGCRKPEKPERISLDRLKVTIAPELMTNRLGGLEGTVYQAYKDSPIHWQPWEPEMLERADAAKRMLFCVMVSSGYPGIRDVMRDLESAPDVVDTINSSYIPVLLDADAAREMQLITTLLSDEIQRPAGYPFFVWIDFNGNPVACTPVNKAQPGGVRQVFTQSHAMISQMWKDDLEKWLADGSVGYVLNNSAYDHLNRIKKVEAALDSRNYVEFTPETFHAALRDVMADYDYYSHSFAKFGQVFPARQLQLVASAMISPGLPDSLRSHASEIVQDMLEHLLPSPMFDPLDDGVFSARSSTSWAFPTFVKSATSQARIAEALMTTYRATRDPRVLDKAARLIQSIERYHQLESGLFVLRPGEDEDPEKWMWSVDEVRAVLGDEDADWWIRATGMRSLGNLPLETDPTRQMFRKNTMGMKLTVTEIAESLKIPVAEFRDRFEATRAKLLATRNARLSSASQDNFPHLESSLLMVSTYAEAYRATGDKAYADKAGRLLGLVRQAFADGSRLRSSTGAMPELLSAARAMHYARAIAAALDAHELQPDAQWLAWANDLWQQVGEQFVGGGIIREAPKIKQVIDLPLDDFTMGAGDSTMGVLCTAMFRTTKAGGEVPAPLVDLLSRVPSAMLQRPVGYADRVLAWLPKYHPASGGSGGQQ